MPLKIRWEAKKKRFGLARGKWSLHFKQMNPLHYAHVLSWLYKTSAPEREHGQQGKSKSKTGFYWKQLDIDITTFDYYVLPVKKKHKIWWMMARRLHQSTH